MRRPPSIAFFSSVIVLVACLLLSACAVPLAPGYKILKESREIHYLSDAMPSVEIDTHYTLQNAGSSELAFVDVTLPAATPYGREQSEAAVDGQAVGLQALPEEFRFDSPNDVRIPIAAAWKRGERHELEVRYGFRSPVQPNSRITLDDSEFHLGERGPLPVLEPPRHLFAGAPKRPQKMDYTVRIPKDFRVLARGTPAGTKQDGAEAVHDFRLGANDLGAFVVAGRYRETIAPGSPAVIYWTFGPVNVDASAARRIGDSWATMEKVFGPLDKNIRSPHIVEVAALPRDIGGEEELSAISFPGGALVSSSALAQGTQTDTFVEAVSHALAHNWLGEQIFPGPSASLVLGEGLPEYAMLVIDEERGGESARRERIARFLGAYDAALKQGPEETLAVSSINDPVPARRIVLAKAALFFAALEDECGATQMRSGLKEIVTLMRGQEVNYPDLRSALEHASGKDLAPTFRLWLNEKGIPADFRARYSRP